MKKIALLLTIAIVAFSCKNDDDTPTPANTTVKFRFTQNWNGDNIANADYENTTYINAAGEQMTLSKLNYLISDVTFTSTANGTVYPAEDYKLVIAREGENDASNIEFTPAIEIPEGEYTVAFTFGFDDEDNDKEGGYVDLNSADSGWGVPAPLGGGYHYQRIEGTFVNDADIVTNYQYHTIRANRHSSLPPGPDTLVELVDTSFVVNLGTVTIGSDTTIEVKANIAEWFNPWVLNERFQVLMPNFQAQIDMAANGSDVFSLGAVTQ